MQLYNCHYWDVFYVYLKNVGQEYKWIRLWIKSRHIKSDELNSRWGRLHARQELSPERFKLKCLDHEPWKIIIYSIWSRLDSLLVFNNIDGSNGLYHSDETPCLQWIMLYYLCLLDFICISGPLSFALRSMNRYYNK